MDVRRELVVVDDPRFASCHASTVAVLDDGHVLVAWFAGSREGAGDVAIWSSRRMPGQGWSPSVKVADEPGLPHWNPVLFRPPGTASVVLFYKVGHEILRWQTRVLRSEDGGGTWTEPVDLVPGDEGGRGPVKNKPIVLAGGTWAAPASIERAHTWDAFVDLSDDEGRTWRQSRLVPLDHVTFAGKGVIQPSLWESAPGRLHMLLRSTCGHACRSDSTDGGQTWSAVTATSLPNNNSGLDLVRLADGRLVCIHNPVGLSWGPRTPLTAAVSVDNGHTWRHWLTLEGEEPGGEGEWSSGEGGSARNEDELSYPAVVSGVGGELVVTYTWQRRGIACVRMPPPQGP